MKSILTSHKDTVTCAKVVLLSNKLILKQFAAFHCLY